MGRTSKGAEQTPVHVQLDPILMKIGDDSLSWRVNQKTSKIAGFLHLETDRFCTGTQKKAAVRASTAALPPPKAHTPCEKIFLNC